MASSTSLFVAAAEAVLSRKLEGIHRKPASTEERVANCDAVVGGWVGGWAKNVLCPLPRVQRPHLHAPDWLEPDGNGSAHSRGCTLEACAGGHVCWCDSPNVAVHSTRLMTRPVRSRLAHLLLAEPTCAWPISALSVHFAQDT